MTNSSLWTISEDSFDPKKQHHKETIFTIGNGYLSTRGAFEEGYPGDRRATFVHGVFDAVPIVFTELANAPDWLPFTIYLDGERFSLDTGKLAYSHRSLDLRNGVLTRTVKWLSPSGRAAALTFERFVSLADPHILLIRCHVTPDFEGTVEFRATLNGNTDNDGIAHWSWIVQGRLPSPPGPALSVAEARGGGGEGAVYLHNRTRESKIDFVSAMRLVGVVGNQLDSGFWDVENAPTLTLKMAAFPGETLVVNKFVAVATSRDTTDPAALAAEHVNRIVDWPAAFDANTKAWAQEWERADVVIEGDDEAQIAIRFNLFQMLIAAPRSDDRVSIGTKTLSGFGYRGHVFWDTEIFMLPLFIYTAPHIARNLLHYRWRNLPGARRKAQANGCEGAQFPWESAEAGEEVTPTWVPHFADLTQLVRIWTGDIEIHISADIAYAAHRYWQITSDDAWLVEKGAELILDTAKFWASRAEWNAEANRYEYNDVIGPDEYHEHVDNNAFTNRMAQWNLQTALEVLEWLKEHAPEKAKEMIERLDLNERRLENWREVIEEVYLHVEPSGLIEQFEGYFKRKEIDLAALEPRTKSAQEIFGIEGCNETQVLKQPDVLMLQYLLRDHYSDEAVRINYDYYTPRTDHTYGSSLGPSIQAIMACEAGRPDEAYEHFTRAVRADLRDVRSNAGDGIHAASAAGTWQAVVFGFGGLRVTAEGWSTHPRLPRHWKRVAFKFYHRGKLQEVALTPSPIHVLRMGEGRGGGRVGVRAFIFDLDGVLTDTAEYHYRGWKRLADEDGIPFTRQDNESLRGIPRRESLLLILKGRQVPEEKLQKMMERKNRYYLEFIKEITPRDLLPGAKEFLEEIRAARLKVAIGSASKNTREVIDRLGIRPLLDAISDGYSVERQKPAPDLFLHTAAQLGLPPASCVVVEDAAAGIEAAIAGGFRAIGLGPRERMGKADLVLPSLENARLVDILEALK